MAKYWDNLQGMKEVSIAVAGQSSHIYRRWLTWAHLSNNIAPPTAAYDVTAFGTTPSGPAGNNIPTGNGWGFIPDPSAVGSTLPGVTPIARWNCVPFQDVSGPFEVGLLAYHMSGVEEVLIAADGDQSGWLTLSTLGNNSRTGTYEYFGTLQVSDLNTSTQNSMRELRAIISPRAGQPRVLQRKFLSTNSYISEFPETDPHYPEQSLEFWYNTNTSSVSAVDVFVGPTGFTTSDLGDGTTSAAPLSSVPHAISSLFSTGNLSPTGKGVINLLAGSHSIGNVPISYIGVTSAVEYVSNNRWLTIRGAVNLATSDVLVSLGAGYTTLRSHKLELKQLSFSGTMTETTVGSKVLWLNNVLLSSLSGAGTTWHEGYANTYATDCDIQRNMIGFSKGHVVRACTVINDRAGASKEPDGDVFSFDALNVNCRVKQFPQSSGFTDSNVITYDRFTSGTPFIGSGTANGPVTDVIVYGLSAVNLEGIRFTSDGVNIHKKMAIVNCLLEARTDTSALGTGVATSSMSTFGKGYDHLVVWFNTIPHGSTWQFGPENTRDYVEQNSNYSFIGNCLEHISSKGDSAASIVALGINAFDNSGVQFVSNHMIGNFSGLSGSTSFVDNTSGVAGFVSGTNLGINYTPSSGATLEGRVDLSWVLLNAPVDIENVVRATSGTAIGCYKGTSEV